MTTFINEVTESIVAARPELKVEVKNVLKNNDVELTALNIIDDNINTIDGHVISPMIYLESYFEDYKNGKASICDVVESLLKVYDAHKDSSCELSVENFLDYERIKNQLSIDLIGPSNVKRLDDVATIPFLNLHVAARVVIAEDENGSATISVRNEHLKMWNVSMEEVVNQALENDQNDCLVQPIREILIEMMSAKGLPEEMVNDMFPDNDMIPMLVVSTKNKMRGARHLYSRVGLRKAADMIESSLFVIPCSIHELICVPFNQEIEPSELSAMICQVNSTEVSPEEVLADTLYFYDRDNDTVTLVDCQSINDIALDA